MTENLGVAGDIPTAATEDAPTIAPVNRRVTLWRLIIIGLLIVFVGFLAYGLNRENKSDWRASGIAPDFTFTTFDGKTIHLADLKGKGVVLNFWASWCDPCRDEAKLLEQAWQHEQGNNIVFLGLDYLDQEYAAKAYLREFGITYASGPDMQSAAARQYGITGVPETFFIGPDGMIKNYLLKQLVNEAELNHYLDTIRPK
jgi:cytochrome c biogenesis protein CcmG/thiol:disulfide interchange protein DsbE